MATRYGWEIAEQLAKRGWKVIPPPEDTFGDPRLIDPVTSKELNPYQAEIEQFIRDKEVANENLPELTDLV